MPTVPLPAAEIPTPPKKPAKADSPIRSAASCAVYSGSMSNRLVTLIPSCKISATPSVAPPLARFLASFANEEPSLVDRFAARSPRSFISILVRSCSPLRPINACGTARPADLSAASSSSQKSRFSPKFEPAMLLYSWPYMPAAAPPFRVILSAALLRCASR